MYVLKMYNEMPDGSIIVTEQPVAMSAACKNKEGAWAFIRHLLLPGGNTIVENAFGDSYSYMPSPSFAGDRSAAETAKLIQGRVQLYLGGTEVGRTKRLKSDVKH